jgi:transcriptional regulator with XRE-family HTH domain
VSVVESDPAAPGREGSDREISGALSIGGYLARQRRLRGMSLDDLASLTRIPLRSLERLEQGAFDRQDDGFARGFVRTVAEALGLDAEEAVMRLLVEPASGDEDFAARRIALRRLAFGSALLLGGAAVIFALGSLHGGGASEPAADPSQEVVYRRDVVRDLAEAQRASGGGAEPLASGRERHRDRGPDSPRR